MTPETPVGACGDAAPTGDPHEQIGYQAVQIDTATRTITALITAIDNGDPQAMRQARDVAAHTLDYLKEYP